MIVSFITNWKSKLLICILQLATKNSLFVHEKDQSVIPCSHPGTNQWVMHSLLTAIFFQIKHLNCAKRRLFDVYYTKYNCNDNWRLSCKQGVYWFFGRFSFLAGLSLFLVDWLVLTWKGSFHKSTKTIMKMLAENPSKWLFRSKTFFVKSARFFCIWPLIYLLNNALLFVLPVCCSFLRKSKPKYRRVIEWCAMKQNKRKSLFQFFLSHCPSPSLRVFCHLMRNFILQPLHLKV